MFNNGDTVMINNFNTPSDMPAWKGRTFVVKDNIADSYGKIRLSHGDNRPDGIKNDFVWLEKDLTRVESHSTIDYLDIIFKITDCMSSKDNVGLENVLMECWLDAKMQNAKSSPVVRS